MRKLNFLIIVSTFCLFFIYGCTSSVTDTAASLDGKWLLKTLNEEKIIKEKAGREMPYLNFNLKNNSVSGNTGCNDLGGKIVVTSDKINFSDMSMTKIACSDAEYELKFVDNIFNAEPVKYKIENNVLTLLEDGKVIMTFEKTK